MLDLNFTKELEAEGLARDLIRVIQQARKDAGFNVSDHIKLAIEIDKNSQEILQSFVSFINEQTLSMLEFAIVDEKKFSYITEKDMEDIKVKLAMLVR